MSAMTIAKLAQAGGVGVETVRYYQRRGLLREPQRPDGSGLRGGVRKYGEQDAKRLRFIRSAQAAGFTLEEIGELLALDATKNRSRAREMARIRIAALNARLAELIAARDALARLATECEKGDAGACPILTAFDGQGDGLRGS